MNRALTFRMIGFVASLILTLIAYMMIVNPDLFPIKTKLVVAVIFALALIQSAVQLIFFINVWEEKGTYWNLFVFISTVAVIFIVIFFSIWIINHLNYNMH